MEQRPPHVIIDALITLGLKEMLDEVCAIHRVTPEQVCGRRRPKDIALARHELYWRLRNTPMTFDSIGRIFDRKHSTIVRGVNAFRRSARGIALENPTLPRGATRPAGAFACAR